jgi:hypothetical protein
MFPHNKINSRPVVRAAIVVVFYFIFLVHDFYKQLKMSTELSLAKKTSEPLCSFLSLHAFFISNTFIKNTGLKFVKNLADAKQHSQAEKRENCPNVAILRLFGDENKQHVGCFVKILKQHLSLT